MNIVCKLGQTLLFDKHSKPAIHQLENAVYMLVQY